MPKSNVFSTLRATRKVLQTRELRTGAQDGRLRRLPGPFTCQRSHQAHAQGGPVSFVRNEKRANAAHSRRIRLLSSTAHSHGRPKCSDIAKLIFLIPESGKRRHGPSAPMKIDVPTLRLSSGQAPVAKSGRQEWGTRGYVGCVVANRKGRPPVREGGYPWFLDFSLKGSPLGFSSWKSADKSLKKGCLCRSGT